MKIAFGIGLFILIVGLSLALWFFTRESHNEDSLGYAVATMFSLAVAALGGLVIAVTGAVYLIAWVYG